MKKLALGVILAGFLAACGGGDDDGGNVDPLDPVDAAVEESTDTDGGGPVVDACNPLGAAGQQGCASGQKCTWITLVDDGNPDNDLGKLGCVPDGTAAIGTACTAGEPGEATGYDNCAAGSYCIAGTCQDICGFQGGTDSACSSGFACTRYASLFANGDDDPAFGACNPTCDPLTQAAGGTPCGTNKGCYLLSDDTGTVGVCAGAGAATNIHNVQVSANTSTTPVYVNSCAPGFMPRVVSQGANPVAVECGGFCKAADVYNDTAAAGTTPATPGSNDGRSGRPNYEGGNTTFNNWAGTPATCMNAARVGRADADAAIAAGTVDPSNTTTGESCQYYFMSERYDGVSAFSNSVGLCFQFRAWRYDATPPTDGSTPVPDTAWPSCRDLNRGTAGLPQTLVTAGATDGAQYFGCVQYMPEMMRTAARNAIKWDFRSPLKLDRLAPPNR